MYTMNDSNSSTTTRLIIEDTTPAFDDDNEAGKDSAEIWCRSLVIIISMLIEGAIQLLSIAIIGGILAVVAYRDVSLVRALVLLALFGIMTETTWKVWEQDKSRNESHRQ